MRSLSEELQSHGLTEFEPVCNQIINAFEEFPDLDEYDRPQKQLLSFLSYVDCDEAELKIRFKHEISKLRVFNYRAFKRFDDKKIVFLDPLNETYRDFNSQRNAMTYSTCLGYPAEDIIIKYVEAIIN